MSKYQAETRAEAIGLALSIGPVRAARELGIPIRTVTNWTHSPEAAVLRIGTQEQLAQRLREAVGVGVEQVLAGLKDPSARLGDKARALEVCAQQLALLTGEATSRTENLNVTADASLVPLTNSGLRAQLVEWMTLIEYATDDELAEHEGKATRMLEVARNALLIEGDDAS